METATAVNITQPSRASSQIEETKKKACPSHLKLYSTGMHLIVSMMRQCVLSNQLLFFSNHNLFNLSLNTTNCTLLTLKI